MKKEIAVAQNGIDGLMAQAIAAGSPIETLERLMAMRDKWMKDKAREAFVSAMGSFQAACPVIKKTRQVMNKDGRSVRYTFAPIDSIVIQIKKPLKDAGLSYRWEVKNEGGKMPVTCIVTHVLGHFESSTFDVPVDDSGFMTAPQKVASALTFAKRYSMINVLGIATSDEDTDATDVNKEPQAKSEKAKIVFLLRSLGRLHSTKDEICREVKDATKLELTPENYAAIVDMLEVLVGEKNADTVIE